MRKVFLMFFLFMSVQTFAQIPNGYYASATGTGFALKSQLHTIIKNYIPKSYNSLWSLYSNSAYRDNYYENDGSLLDIYSEKINEIDFINYNSTLLECGSTTTSYEGLCYNREHLVPESFFESYFNSIGIDTSINSVAYYAKNDAHFIPPTDIRVNAWRGNLPFGRLSATNLNPCAGGDGPSFSPTNLPCYTSNVSKIGFNNNSGYSAGYTGNVFEPIDEFKGDVARAVLYFVTRYEDVLPLMYSTCSNTTAKAMFNGSSGQGLNATFLNIMKTWHQNDPVSEREIAINNRIYTHQSNRNPFIDHPEWVTTIWGSPLQTKTFELLSAISVYPNPAVDNRITIEADTMLDEINLISTNGQLMLQIKNPNSDNNRYLVENLPQGFYFLKLFSNNESITKKIIIN